MERSTTDVEPTGSSVDSNRSFNQVRRQLVVCWFVERLSIFRIHPPAPSARHATKPDRKDLQSAIGPDVQTEEVAVVDQALHRKRVVMVQIEVAIGDRQVDAEEGSTGQPGEQGEQVRQDVRCRAPEMQEAQRAMDRAGMPDEQPHQSDGQPDVDRAMNRSPDSVKNREARPLTAMAKRAQKQNTPTTRLN